MIDGDSTSTPIRCPATGRWSSVIHKLDMSDLGEPYLSLVKEAREQSRKNKHPSEKGC